MIDVNVEFAGHVFLLLNKLFGDKEVTCENGNRLAEKCGDIERLYKALPDLKTDECQ